MSFLRPLLVSGPSASLDASVVVASILAGAGTPAAMTSRIVVFGATGYTGRLVAERLAAQGARPVLAGRDERRLAELAERLGGLETVKADAMRRNSVFAAVQPGDVLISTVGPVRQVGRRGRARGDRGRRRDLHRLHRRARVHPARVRGARRSGGARRGHADAGDGLRLRARRARGRAGAARGGAEARCAWTSATTRSGWAPAAPAPARASRWSAPRSRTTTRSARAPCARSGPPSGCAHSPSTARSAARSPSAARSTSRSRPSTRGCWRSTSTSAGSGRWPSRCRPARSPGPWR